MSTEISHRFPIEHVMGILWEIKAVQLKYRERECTIEIPRNFHTGKSMVHVDQLLMGMGNLWLILKSECPISLP